jgi:hypothetical protein
MSFYYLYLVSGLPVFFSGNILKACLQLQSLLAFLQSSLPDLDFHILFVLHLLHLRVPPTPSLACLKSTVAAMERQDMNDEGLGQRVNDFWTDGPEQEQAAGPSAFEAPAWGSRSPFYSAGYYQVDLDGAPASIFHPQPGLRRQSNGSIQGQVTRFTHITTHL